MLSEAWDWLRWVNVALACTAVVLLTMGSIIRWDTMPIRIRRITPWIIFTYAVIAYGSGEVAAQPGVDPPGYRVVLLTLSLVGLLVALLYEWDDPQYHAARETWQFLGKKKRTHK